MVLNLGLLLAQRVCPHDTQWVLTVPGAPETKSIHVLLPSLG